MDNYIGKIKVLPTLVCSCRREEESVDHYLFYAPDNNNSVAAQLQVGRYVVPSWGTVRRMERGGLIAK